MVKESQYFKDLEKNESEGMLNTQKYHKINWVWFYKRRVLLDPQSPMYQQVISENHDTLMGDHSRYHHTLHRVRWTFWWRDTKAKIKKAGRDCDICQQHKYETVHLPGLLDPLPMPAHAEGPIYGLHRRPSL